MFQIGFVLLLMSHVVTQPTICRRGAKEADELILELVRIADAVRGDTNKHMAHEEQEVLPLLEAHLCAAEQRAMVWRTLRAMPLRLLERVMPWVAGTCSLTSVDCLNASSKDCSDQPNARDGPCVKATWTLPGCHMGSCVDATWSLPGCHMSSCVDVTWTLHGCHKALQKGMPLHPQHRSTAQRSQPVCTIALALHSLCSLCAHTLDSQ